MVKEAVLKAGFPLAVIAQISAAFEFDILPCPEKLRPASEGNLQCTLKMADLGVKVWFLLEHLRATDELGILDCGIRPI